MMRHNNPQDGILIPVDRVRAAMRFAGRALAALPLVMVAWLISRLIDWKVMFATDRISALALCVVVILLLLTALPLAISAVRWLAFALWPMPMFVRWTRRMLVLKFGPFGSSSIPVQELRVSSIPEFFGQLSLHDDRLPIVRKSNEQLDLMSRIMDFTSARPESLRRALVEERIIAPGGESDSGSI